MTDFPDFMDEDTLDPDSAAPPVDPGNWDGYRAGFVTIVGRPNVGKSTLTNVLVGSKVAITSDRPETTRHSVRGIIQRPQAQVVLVDTPGYHRPRTVLGQRLNDDVHDALSDVDAVIFAVPADQKIGPGDRYIAHTLSKVSVPVIAVVTKTDLVDDDTVLQRLVDVAQLVDDDFFADIVAVSARADDHMDTLVDVLVCHMPASPPLYPTDMTSDEPVTTMIAELVREAALGQLHQELPHSVAVQVEEIIEHEPHDDPPGEGKPPVDVHINIFVERPSQKGIIIGKKGSGISKIRRKSQGKIRKLLGRKAYLKLHVRVAKNWQSDPKMLGRLGF